MNLAIPTANIQRRWRHLRVWARHTGLSRKFAVALAIAATVSGFATYGALTRSGPFGPDAESIIILLNIDLVLLLALGVIVARRLVVLWTERRRGSAGSRLHTRLVMMFSLAAIVPAILVGTFSALFFTLGIDAWFSERVKTALDESAAVSQAYLDEHAANVRAQVLAMARDIEYNNGPGLIFDPTRLSLVLERQATLRDLSEAIVFRSDGRLLGKTSLSFSLALDQVPDELLIRAAGGDVVMVTGDNSDRVRALVQLDSVPGVFLYAGRLVDPIVIGHTARVSSAVEEFQLLEVKRGDLQIAFALVYVIAAMLLLFVAIWFALLFATRLVQPVSALVGAAERVRAGDLTARVPDSTSNDELGSLSRAFNRMTGQLAAQRRELIEANRQIDARRRFTESVLSGVSAGVVGLDAQGRVELPNRRALELLEVGHDELVGHNLGRAVPELSDLLARAMSAPDGRAAGDVTLVRNDHATSLTVRIGSELNADRSGEASSETTGYVVTFDDMTPLMSAQRKAAWADVARRIAHEIKNPLTPIQLSAERLKRKYLSQIQTDPEIFVSCTDTIVRQVGDLRHIVDEFSNFARLPAPVFAIEDAVRVVNDAITLQEVARAKVTFLREFPEAPVLIRCDRRQLGQVLNNLIKNAIEAVEARIQDGWDGQGRIRVTVAREDGRCIIAIHDNGRGLPSGPRDKLFEPYVTHRDKGTGLGLAIAQRIVTEHDGSLTLVDSPDGGANARIVLAAEADEETRNEAAGKVSRHGA